METNRLSKGIIVVVILLFLTSCVSKRAPRKCNGKRGIKTNMGIM